MGMHLMLEIGAKSVYQSALPDFMVWNQVKALPLFWQPFGSGAFTLAAIVLVPALFGLAFGYLAFRSRIRGVYFSIITQALALSVWLVFNRNEMNLGGTNGLADFKTIFGFPLNQPGTQRGLYVVTAATLVAAYLVCRWITLTRAGKVLVAIRDSETRVLFSGYSPAAYKLFVFVVSAILAGVAGALYAPQVGIITPAKIGVLPSIEMVVWVAAGGRGTLYGSVIGAFGVNWIQSWLTTSYPDLWLLFLGGLFMGAVLFFPDGVVGAAGRVVTRTRRFLAGPQDRAILEAPHLSQATPGASRPPSSDK
jgi:urea transport system permease protein